MEIKDAFEIIRKNLEQANTQLGFKEEKAQDENCLFYCGEKGAYRVVYDEESKVVSFDCAYEPQPSSEQFSTVSRSLFDPETYDERDAKSLSNEIADEITSLFKARKKVDLEKVKMPKAVSRTKAKNGVISYDSDSLANRFGVLYPDMKDKIKENIVQYGEFLPETFFVEYGTQRVLDVISSGTEAEQKRLFKMLNEIYEDGTNEVQDIIGVTILGAMKNDDAMMAVADKYMSDYMSGPVHEINKLTRKENKLTKLLKNPPAYKPKKKRTNMLQNTLDAQNINR